MRSRGQVLSAIAVLAVVVAAGVYVQRDVGPRALAAGPSGVAPSGAWFCPHGGGTEWTVALEVANPGHDAVRVRVTNLSAGKPADSKSFTVPPGAELRIPAVAGTRGSSSYIEYFGGWVAAGWVAQAGGGEGGVAAEPCLPEAGQRWFLPDGTTQEHQDAYIVVMNPFAADAVFTITLYTDRGAPIITGDWTNVVLRPKRSEAFHLNAKALGYGTVSAGVDVKVGRIAASALGIADSGGIRSSDGYLGGPPTRMVLPGGFDQGRTDLVVMTPGDTKASLVGTLFGNDGSQPLASLQEATPSPSSAQTYPVTTEGPSALDVSSDSGIALARRTYGVTSDQGSTAGAMAPARAWVILPAVAGPPIHPGLVLANPGEETALVTLSFLPTGTPVPAPVTVSIPAGRTVAAPKSFLEAKPFAAVLAVASSGTVVPAAASYSLGKEGYATYAVSLGVPIPDAWLPS